MPHQFLQSVSRHLAVPLGDPPCVISPWPHPWRFTPPRAPPPSGRDYPRQPRARRPCLDAHKTPPCWPRSHYHQSGST
ncbi:hypothetical protein ACFFX0_16500 [Citricoccus parietis]|uniref:Uncharacterized protein n=1 Tax=Citricoccus parietis TaxID=592307 RepID=A0ABV5G1A2_9MICC